MDSGSNMPPLLQKSAYLGASAIGALAIVKLMSEFASTLKPLVLAAMFVACLEFWVDLFEYAIALLCRTLHVCVQGGQAARGNRVNLEEPLASREAGEKTEAAVAEPEPRALRCALVLARPLAVLTTLALSVLGLVALTMAFVQSLRGADMTVYKTGAVQLEENIISVFKRLDASTQKFLMDHLRSMSDNIAGVVAGLANDILASSSGLFAEVVMFLVYLLMFLLVPVRGDSGRQVFKIMRTFFALKAACNACFALLAFVLLESLRVDFAVIVAGLSFVLGFIPEVGSFLSVFLVVPIILLDSRLSMMMRWEKLAWAAGGLLLVKLLVSNGLESVVMGRNPTLAGILKHGGDTFEETHPVVVLFAVVLLGAIWGPVGMLVSVPLISMVRMAINLENEATLKRASAAQHML